MLGGEGDESLLPGEKGTGSAGDLLVPYADVLASYRDAFVSAVANEAIPLGMRSLVRDYFAALIEYGS